MISNSNRQNNFISQETSKQTFLLNLPELICLYKPCLGTTSSSEYSLDECRLMHAQYVFSKEELSLLRFKATKTDSGFISLNSKKRSQLEDAEDEAKDGQKTLERSLMDRGATRSKPFEKYKQKLKQIERNVDGQVKTAKIEEQTWNNSGSLQFFENQSVKESVSVMVNNVKQEYLQREDIKSNYGTQTNNNNNNNNNNTSDCSLKIQKNNQKPRFDQSDDDNEYKLQENPIKKCRFSLQNQELFEEPQLFQSFERGFNSEEEEEESQDSKDKNENSSQFKGDETLLLANAPIFQFFSDKMLAFDERWEHFDGDWEIFQDTAPKPTFSKHSEIKQSSKVKVLEEQEEFQNSSLRFSLAPKKGITLNNSTTSASQPAQSSSSSSFSISQPSSSSFTISQPIQSTYQPSQPLNSSQNNIQINQTNNTNTNISQFSTNHFINLSDNCETLTPEKLQFGKKPRQITRQQDTSNTVGFQQSDNQQQQQKILNSSMSGEFSKIKWIFSKKQLGVIALIEDTKQLVILERVHLKEETESQLVLKKVLFTGVKRASVVEAREGLYLLILREGCLEGNSSSDSRINNSQRLKTDSSGGFSQKNAVNYAKLKQY